MKPGFSVLGEVAALVLKLAILNGLGLLLCLLSLSGGSGGLGGRCLSDFLGGFGLYLFANNGLVYFAALNRLGIVRGG